jgi:hypothetical protein
LTWASGSSVAGARWRGGPVLHADVRSPQGAEGAACDPSGNKRALIHSCRSGVRRTLRLAAFGGDRMPSGGW